MPRAQEQQVEALVEREQVDLVVLARYMQILWPEFCRALAGRALGADDLTASGRGVECIVLSRAVRWHVEHRVLMNGHKTVVFS